MGFISSQKFYLVLFFVSLISYYISAFRLIHTSQQTQEVKVKSEHKESDKHSDEIQDEFASFKEKTSEKISDKKVKPMQPTPSDDKDDKPSTLKDEPERKSRIIKIEAPKIKETQKVIKNEEIQRKIPETDLKKETVKEETERKSRVIKIEAPKVKELPNIVKKEEVVKKIDKISDPEIKKDVTKEEPERKSRVIQIEAPKKIIKKVESVKKIKEADDDSEEDEPEKKEQVRKSRIIKIEAPQKSIKKDVNLEKIDKSEDESKEDEPTIKPPVRKTKIIKIEAPKIKKPPPVIKKQEIIVKKLDKTPEHELKKEKIEKKIETKLEKKLEISKEEKKVEKPKEESNTKIIKGKQEKLKVPEKKLEVKSQQKPVKEQITSKPTKEVPKPEIIKTVFDSSISSLYFNLPSFSPNFDVVENEECKIQGNILIDQMKNHKLWALKMFDATAKIPSGILKGNLNQLGDYDQCVGIFSKIPIDEESEVKIAGKYCLAHIDFEAEVPEMRLPVHLAQSRALIRSKLQDPGHFIPQFTTIRWGLCIPSGCSAEDAERILEDSLKTYNESSNIGINFDVAVRENQCHVRTPSKKVLDYSYGTLATLGLTATIGVLVLVATIRDVTATDTPEQEEIGKLEKILMTFSLKRTLNSLLQKSDPNEIECIHGVRTICTFILVIAHKLLPLGHVPFTNKTTLTEMSNHPFSIVLRSSFIYTDSFLLLSGILTSYAMSKDMEEKDSIPWFNRIVARFTRLTPSLFFMLLYYTYVLDILGEGPLWSTVITSNVELCETTWWRNILYIQNFYPFQEMCATHTHQLALDMQLSLIAPILVWMLYRKQLLGICITVLLHFVSVYSRYSATMNYRLSLIIYHGISMSQLYRTANMMYASSIHRATPYIAGVALGVLLRQIKPNFYMPKVVIILGWLVAGYFASWALYTPSHLSSRTYKYDINEAAQFAALCSLAWALALSWLIFACFIDKKSYLNIFLSSRPVIILSRLSYTLYLTQFIVFFYNVGTVRTSSEFSISSSLNFTEFAIILILSTLLTLMVDMPVQKIKNILFKSSPVHKNVDISSETNDIKKMRENSLENTKKVTISEEVQILDDSETEALYNKYRQLSTESEPGSEDLTEEIEEILDEDEEMIQNLESKMRQFSTESEPASEFTEETEELDDEEVVETSENRMRQSSLESQPSLDDIEDIIYDEETEETNESFLSKPLIKNQHSTEDVEELEHDEEIAEKKVVQQSSIQSQLSTEDVEEEEIRNIEDEPIQSTVKTQLSSDSSRETEYEAEITQNIEAIPLQSQQSAEDIEEAEGNDGFVSITANLAPGDMENLQQEDVIQNVEETSSQPEDVKKQETEAVVERFVFRFRPRSVRTDLSSEETEKPDDDEEIVQNLERNVRKSSTDTTRQQLNDDE